MPSDTEEIFFKGGMRIREILQAIEDALIDRGYDHYAVATHGQADLLFQNTNGAMQLWEMNGTSIATTLNLPNPGAGWQSVNGRPFATG